MQALSYFQEMGQLALQGQTRGIWFWAGVYAFLICWFSLIFQLRTRYWPSVNGELVNLDIEKFGPTAWVKSNQDYRSNALYRYQVDGVTYQGKRVSPWVFVASHNARMVLDKQLSSVQRLPDGRVKVFYNPARPNKSFLVVAGKTGMIVTLIASLLPLVSYFFKYHA